MEIDGHINDKINIESQTCDQESFFLKTRQTVINVNKQRRLKINNMDTIKN